MKTFLLFWTLAFLGVITPVWAADTNTHTLLGFADYLRDQGDYYRAITEYERFAFLNPTDDRCNYAHLQMGYCYILGKKYEAAERLLLEIKEHSGDQETRKDAALMLSDAYIQMRKFSRAEALLAEFERTCPTDSRMGAVRLHRAFCQAWFGQEEWSHKTLQAIPSDSKEGPLAKEMLNTLTCYTNIPQKSPRLAGWLSALLPGAGQLYDGRPDDALVSFAINGIMIGAAIVAFHNDEDVAGSFIVGFEATWYLGNIYSAVNGARKFNDRQRETFFDKLKISAGMSRAPGDRGSLMPTAGVGMSF